MGQRVPDAEFKGENNGICSGKNAEKQIFTADRAWLNGKVVRLSLPMELRLICRGRLHGRIYRWDPVHILCIQAQSPQTSTRTIYSAPSTRLNMSTQSQQRCLVNSAKSIINVFEWFGIQVGAYRINLEDFSSISSRPELSTCSRIWNLLLWCCIVCFRS